MRKVRLQVARVCRLERWKAAWLGTKRAAACLPHGPMLQNLRPQVLPQVVILELYWIAVTLRWDNLGSRRQSIWCRVRNRRSQWPARPSTGNYPWRRAALPYSRWEPTYQAWENLAGVRLDAVRARHYLIAAQVQRRTSIKSETRTYGRWYSEGTAFYCDTSRYSEARSLYIAAWAGPTWSKPATDSDGVSKV